MNKRSRIPLGILIVLAFMAPIAGGQLPLDALNTTDSGELLKSFFGSPEAPMLGHAMLALMAALAAAIILAQRKIIQIPSNIFNGMMSVFFLVIVASIGISSYVGYSVQAAVEWVTYAIAFYAVTAAVGRKNGPVAIIAAIAAGCSVLSLLGILEYTASKADGNATWRIFSLWVNPNALAAMLLLGFFCSLNLAVTRVRIEAIAAGAMALLTALAILLTQSKGVMLCLGLGTIFNLIMIAAWDKSNLRWARLGRVIGVLAVVILAFGVMQKQASAAGTASRIVNSDSTSVQSEGFRANLWKSAIALGNTRPSGYGIGTFRFESSRPGITTQTQFAHNSYLQLFAEASPLALLLIIGIAGFWFFQMFRGARKLPTEQNLLRAGVMSTIFAVGAHNFIDSDLYYYGIGMCFFMLLGVGLLLASDAVAPENTPKPARYAFATWALVFACAMMFFGWVDAQKTLARGLVADKKYPEALAIADQLATLPASDGEGYYLKAVLARNDADRLNFLKKATEVSPSARNLRTMARTEAEMGLTPQAIGHLKDVLVRDPNNFPALLQLGQLQVKADQIDAAGQTFQRLIDVEKTAYFTVRALPEIVPTETYEARIELAKLLRDPASKVKLLSQAVEGLDTYRRTTLPMVKQSKDLPGGMAGETMDRATKKMNLAADAAAELITLDPTQATKWREAEASFRSAMTIKP